eukprot:1136410-Pelagomonas_calceolata.AAC.1
MESMCNHGRHRQTMEGMCNHGRAQRDHGGQKDAMEGAKRPWEACATMGRSVQQWKAWSTIKSTLLPMIDAKQVRKWEHRNKQGRVWIKSIRSREKHVQQWETFAAMGSKRSNRKMCCNGNYLQR